MVRPEWARLLERYLAELDGGVEIPPMPDLDASWATLAARMRAESSADAGHPAPGAGTPTPLGGGRGPAPHRHFLLPSAPARPWWRRSLLTAGAAFAAALVIGALSLSRDRVAPPLPAPRVYETTPAQRAEIVLSDGTRITLAPESRLRVAADFGTERRDVYLEGEAFFDVAHDAVRPFTAYAGNASAHDIGTAFAIRSYPRDRAVQVAVREGVVAMSGVGPLAAGDVGTLASDGRATVRHGGDTASALGWLDGRFSYTDAPLTRVVEDLHRWHDADITIRDSALADLPFTGEMNGLSTSSALDLVARTLGLRVKRDGDRFTLAADAGRTPHPMTHASR